MANNTVPAAQEHALALAGAIRNLSVTDRLLIGLDFDGTLSTLVDSPADARVLPRAAEAIAKLEAHPNTWVAYVSGRPLRSLISVTEADEAALLIGSHGVEVRLDGGEIDLGLTDEEKRKLSLLESSLGEIVGSAPGAMLETKPVGLGVHTRLVETGLVSGVQEASRRAAREIGGFNVRDGKDILEFAIREATKGDGLEVLRRRLKATAVLYIGDDVTDEDGFAVLHEGDMGVKVGPGETAAEFRVSDPHAVAQLLTLLESARATVGAEEF